MTTDKRQFTLRLQEENFLKIKHIAQLEKRSIAMQIEFLIEEAIGRFEKDNGEIHIDEEYK